MSKEIKDTTVEEILEEKKEDKNPETPKEDKNPEVEVTSAEVKAAEATKSEEATKTDKKSEPEEKPSEVKKPESSEAQKAVESNPEPESPKAEVPKAEVPKANVKKEANKPETKTIILTPQTPLFRGLSESSRIKGGAGVATVLERVGKFAKVSYVRRGIGKQIGYVIINE